MSSKELVQSTCKYNNKIYQLKQAGLYASIVKKNNHFSKPVYWCLYINDIITKDVVTVHNLLFYNSKYCAIGDVYFCTGSGKI